MTIADWTQGGAGLSLQHCRECGHDWAFARSFCPRCGSLAPELRPAAGTGRVYSTTRVDRAPTPELKALAPYTIALVDLDEGVRVMVHAAPDLAIGTAVQVTYREFGARLVPYVVALAERGGACGASG